MNGDIQHWTRIGTFKIVPVMLNASRFYELWIGDQKLGTYGWAVSAAQSISAGEHDEKLSEPGKSLNVPDDILEWNGLR